VMSDDQIDKRRADAVKRYWQKLRQIVADTLFKVKFKDKEEAQTTLTYLQKIPPFFDALLSVNSDTINHEDKIKVNEEFLITLLDKLVEKKQAYLSILDKAGLIFRETDEVNLDQMTSEFVQGG